MSYIHPNHRDLHAKLSALYRLLDAESRLWIGSASDRVKTFEPGKKFGAQRKAVTITTIDEYKFKINEMRNQCGESGSVSLIVNTTELSACFHSKRAGYLERRLQALALFEDILKLP